MCTWVEICLWFSVLSINYKASGIILPPDGTGFYIETLLQNYKAELCNKKIHLGVL
jgi:hypothetical protein